MYNIGDVVTLYDNIDDDLYNTGVIRFMEQDDQIPNLFWLYIMANDETLNVNMDPRFPFFYWRIVEASDPHLFKAEIIN